MQIRFLTLLPVVVALASWVATAQPDTAGSYETREWIDELSTRELEILDQVLERREILSEISTRDLYDELSERLERRGSGNSIIKPKKPDTKNSCPYCGTKYATAKEAKDCATKPRILGGCKVAGAVKHVQ